VITIGLGWKGGAKSSLIHPGVDSLIQLHEDLAFASPASARDLDLSLSISRAQRVSLYLEAYLTDAIAESFTLAALSSVQV
jgi:hypothetical protein